MWESNSGNLVKQEGEGLLAELALPSLSLCGLTVIGADGTGQYLLQVGETPTLPRPSCFPWRVRGRGSGQTLRMGQGRLGQS